MDARTILSNLSSIAAATGRVERLRELVLNLAVSGKLVEQDPEEGHGHSVVASGIEVITLAIANGWSRRRHLHAPESDEVPYRIPASWVWARLPQVTHGLGQVVPSFDFSYIDVGAVDGATGTLKGSPDVLAPKDAPLRARKSVEPGTVLYSTIRPYLRNIIHIDQAIDPPAIASTAFAVLRPVPTLDPVYLKLCLRAGYFSRFVESRQKGVAYPAISEADLAWGLVPIPPHPEQKRIVAKVDELMRLCNDLEFRQACDRHAKARFRDSALFALTAAESRDGLRSAWTRVEHNWRAIAEDPDAVPALRSTLLQLAVEGRLAGRSEDEGTGDDALSRATAQRSELAQLGHIDRLTPPLPLVQDDCPYAVPSHWTWVRVEEVVTHVVDCLHRTPKYTDSGYPAIRTCDVEPGRVLIDKALRVDEETFVEQIRRLTPQQGDVLYSREGGRFGIAAVVPENTQLCLSQRMMHFRCADAVVPAYFSWFLNSPLGFGQAAEDAGGSASPHVNIKSIRRFLMPLPPTAEQRRIVDALELMLAQVDQLTAAFRARDRSVSELGSAIAEWLVRQPIRHDVPA